MALELMAELAFKQGEKEGAFYCEINLKLREYGELKLMVVLYEEKQLNMMIRTEKEELKEKLKVNFPTLRQALLDVGIMPRQIRFFDLNEEKTLYAPDTDQTDLGFRVKV